MRDCDVVIVGGGPAGAACAWALGRAGLDVTVLDRATFPRDKVCAGWVTPAVLAELEVDADDYAAAGRVLEPIRGFRIGVMGRGELEVEYTETVSYGIRRCELDGHLLERSRARLALGQPLSGLERGRGRWVVNGDLRAPLLIGAGGHFCPVARHLGAKLGRSEAPVIAQETELELTPEEVAACAVRPQAPELYFAPDLRGYGWCFLKGSFLNVGLGRQDPDRFGDHMRRFVEDVQRRRGVPRRYGGSAKGHAYLLYRDARRTVLADGVLLVGDAAGLADTKSGEGIRPAIESALLAAEVVVAAGGDYREGRLAGYEEKLSRHFGERGKEPPGAPPRWKCAAAAWLMGQRWFCRRVVLDRWFLRRHQAPLWDSAAGVSEGPGIQRRISREEIERWV